MQISLLLWIKKLMALIVSQQFLPVQKVGSYCEQLGQKHLLISYLSLRLLVICHHAFRDKLNIY